MWWLFKIKRKAQQRGCDLCEQYNMPMSETKTKKAKWVHRFLIRLDRIVCGKKPFRKRDNHPLEICNKYFGLE